MTQCDENYEEPIRVGDRVTIHYIGTLEDGFEFESTKNKAPLVFIAGSDEVIAGISNGVIGMKQGDDKELKISPEDAYGPRFEALISQIRKTDLPPNAVLEIGEQFSLEMKDSSVATVAIIEILDDSVVVDANHPLAGLNLNFRIGIELVESRESLTGLIQAW